MGMYTSAAHEAARTVADQASLLECLVPANALVREFLLGVRRQLLQEGGDGVDKTAAQIKLVAEGCLTYPFRVHDCVSAQKVKHCGPFIGKMIAENLFAAYPPAPLCKEELEAEQKQEVAMKAASAAQRKRKKQEAVAGLAGGITVLLPGTAAAASAAARAAAATGTAAAATAGPPAGEHEDGQKEKKRRKKASKEYIPQLHSAPFAFLICMLKAQKGPAKQQHLGKQELMELAEASGLSKRSIFGGSSSARQLPAGHSYCYNGWSSFRSSVIVKGLAHEWSNPKRVSLTPQGFALAERLYRDGVARGVLQPIAGIPIEGPMLFQLEGEGLGAAAAAVAAGVLEGVLPSVTLQAGRRLPMQQQQQQPVALAQQLQDEAEVVPTRRPSAVLAAATAAATASYEPNEPDYYSFSLAERLQRQQSAAQHLHQADQQPAASRRTPQARWRKCGIGNSSGCQHSGAATARPAAPSPGSDVIDLLSDDSPSPLRKRRMVAAASPAAAAASSPAGRGATAAVAATAEVLDEQAAVMVGMGYSDKKAQQALQRSAGDKGLHNIGWAVESAELLASNGNDSGAKQPGAGVLAAGPRAAHRAPSRGARAAALGALPHQTQQQAAEAPPPPLPAQGGWCGGASLPAAGPIAAGAAVAAAPLQRHGSGRSQQPQGLGPGGHIRMGSQQQQPEEPAAKYDIDRFLTQVNHQLRGVPDSSSQHDSDVPGRAAGDLARNASGSSGAGCSDGGVHVRNQEVRLPPLLAGTRFGEQYEVLMLMDQREQVRRTKGQGVRAALDSHIATMRRGGLEVEDRQLPIGDVLWIARSRHHPATEFVLDLVLERKTMEDLVSSIKGTGNRYERQKYHLKRCGLRQVYYLLEGDPDMLPSEVEQKMVRSAAASTEVMDGFTVLRTTDYRSTFRLYHRLTRHIQDWYHDLLGSSASTAGQLPTFAAWQAQCKESAEGTTTLHDVFGMMLAAVPTLGAQFVQAIIGQYPTPLHLYRAYQAAVAAAERAGKDGHRAAECLLQGLKCNGGKQSVGPERSAKVYNVLFRRRAVRGQPVAVRE